MFFYHFNRFLITKGCRSFDGIFVRKLAIKARKSYAYGASNIPLINQTIGEIFREKVERNPDQEFVIFPADNGVRKTYAQCYDDCLKFASGLLAVGLKPGDRVGIWSPNVYEWVLTQLSTAMAGLILTNINPAYQVPELKYCLEKVGVRAVIAAQQFKTQNYYEMLFELCPELANCKAGKLHSRLLPELRHVIQIGGPKNPGTFTVDEIMDAGDSKSRKNLLNLHVNPDKPVNIQYTSGTTGLPKGATLTHHQIVNNAYFVGIALGAHQNKLRICCAPPLYHCFGCVVGTLLTIAHSATLIFPSLAFNAATTLKAVNDEKCTTLYGTPAMFIDMLNCPDFPKYSCETLKTGIMAGAPCPTHLRELVVEKLNIKELQVLYGTTENSPSTNITKRDDPLEMRIKSVGQPLDHVEVKIADPHGNVVEIGKPGEVCTRGYMVMRGYWNDVDKTREVIDEDRWYRMGDVGVMSEEGHVTIIGRLKDMIIRGGENVYPTEIEYFLASHPKIADAQVIGVPDERLGEEVCVWIRLHPDEKMNEEDVRKFCKGKLAHFKIPKYIMFKEQSEFPMTVTGKVQKYRMREIAKTELGLEHIRPHMPQ